MKQNRLFLAVLATVLVTAVSCGLAWLAGYNFDYRSPGVAFWGLDTLLAVIIVLFLTL